MKKEWIILLIIVVLLGWCSNQVPKQTVVPDCTDKEACWKPLVEGYCGVNYDCIAGKCYQEDVKCPEICDSGLDEDLDGDISCADSDCWNSPDCSCEQMSYGNCLVGRCYCQEGVPRWVVTDGGDSWCACI